jgi:hypothetical protein
MIEIYNSSMHSIEIEYDILWILNCIFTVFINKKDYTGLQI